jgi:penicillin-binding protein 1C
MQRCQFQFQHLGIVIVGLIAAIFFGRAGYLYVAASPEQSPTLYDRAGRILNVRLSEDHSWRLPFTGNGLNSNYAQGLICIEDRAYARHLGVDSVALARALLQSIESGRTVSGASTIPMQLARMIHRLPRKPAAKILEMLDATIISIIFSKAEILRLYAERVPMGGNVEGAETAANWYFGKPLKELSWRELAVLYLLPQSPRRLSAWQADDWQRGSDRILQRLHDCGLLDDDQLHASLADHAPVPHPRGMPRDGEHIADAICTENDGPCVRATTIDRGLQLKLQELVKSRRQSLAEKGIYNIAVGVVDNDSGAILGLIGNFNYLGMERGQKIAAFNVLRSPGSTMKPLIYGLALDERLILPETVVEDRPMSFGAYSPENYSGQYSGLVRAKQALAQSLNVPFVHLLSQLGVERFLIGLDQSGVNQRTPNDRLGLSLAIGGMEIRFLDVLKLYHGLALGGRQSPMHLVPGAASPLLDSRFLSEGAAYLTTLAMSQRDRPEADHLSHALGKDTSIAWKTGTSQNRLDAWSVGFNRRFTVAVWLGNLDRQSSAHLVGAETAAPIFFDLFATLNESQTIDRWSPPLSVSKIQVCALSGLMPTAACPSRISSDSLEGDFPHRSCPYHQHVFVDAQTGRAIAPQCLGKRDYKIKSVTSLPRQLRRWLAHGWTDEWDINPVDDVSCAPDSAQHRKVAIQSPKSGSRFFVMPSFEQHTITIPFRAEAQASDGISCFLNHQQVRLGHQDALQLPVGKYRLVCSDQWGNSDASAFEVAAFNSPNQSNPL